MGGSVSSNDHHDENGVDIDDQSISSSSAAASTGVGGNRSKRSKLAQAKETHPLKKKASNGVDADSDETQQATTATGTAATVKRGEPGPLERSWKYYRAQPSATVLLWTLQRYLSETEIPNKVETVTEELYSGNSYTDHSTTHTDVAGAAGVTNTTLNRVPLTQEAKKILDSVQVGAFPKDLRQTVFDEQQEDLRLAQAPSTSSLELEISVFDPHEHLNNPFGVVITFIRKGEFAAASKNTLLGQIASHLGYDVKAGLPALSKSYTSHASTNSSESIVLTRIHQNLPFESLWVVEIPGNLTYDKMVETLHALKFHSKSISFFQGSQILIPVLGDSAESKVPLSAVMQQYISWAFHSFKENTVSKITILTTDAKQVDVIGDALGEFKELLKKVQTDQGQEVSLHPAADSQEFFLYRSLVSGATDELVDCNDAIKSFIEENDGKIDITDSADKQPDANPSRSRLQLFELVHHHVDMLTQLYDSKPKGPKLVRFICETARSIIESFLNQTPQLKGNLETQTLHAKIYKISAVMSNHITEHIAPEDFEHIRILVIYGFLVNDPRMAGFLHEFDAYLALNSILHMCETITEEDEEENEKSAENEPQQDSPIESQKPNAASEPVSITSPPINQVNSTSQSQPQPKQEEPQLQQEQQ